MDSFYATHKSSPAIGFGTSIRGGLVEGNGGEAPGPGAYTIKTTVLGNYPEAKIRTAPQFSLRSREKFGSPMTKAEDTTSIMEPGPGHYKPRIVNPVEMIAPKYTIPKSRWISDKAKLQPGPGAYNCQGSCEKQVLSTKRNFMPGKFGKGKRPQLNMVSTGPIGPGEYGCGIGACDEQVDSRKKTYGNMRFAHTGREQTAIGARKTTDDIPGPGHYKLPKGLGGRGAGYVYRCSPMPKMSGRESFGSPW